MLYRKAKRETGTPTRGVPSAPVNPLPVGAGGGPEIRISWLGTIIHRHCQPDYEES